MVHAHSGQAHNQALRATLGSDIIRVVTRHVAFPPKHPLIHRLKYTKTCHGIIAVSTAVREVLIAAGIPADHIQVIHTGIELPPPPAPRDPHIPRTVGHMGAFTQEKGQDIAIAAARLLPNVRFILAGDGPLLNDLRATAPANVEFPGFVTDKEDFFATLDYFLMPSRSEAWGLAALEAMSHGVPVIAANIPGLSEIITPESGYLIPAENPEALAEAITTAQPLSPRPRAEQFSIEEMATQTEHYYATLISSLSV
ncbi:MAG: glycosyltransferase family 4 protein [Acidobacteriota bacterium]